MNIGTVDAANGMITNAQLWVVIITMGLTAFAAFFTALSVLLSQKQLIEAIKNNELVAAQLKAAIDSNQKITAGQRLMASHEFIVKIETDKETLEARAMFGRIRDNGGADEFLKIFTQQFDNKHQEILFDEITVENAYRMIVRYLNTLEMTAVGIRTGCYQEATLKKMSRGAFVRNVTCSEKAIKKLREVAMNPDIFTEAAWLAIRWAEAGNETKTANLDKSRWKNAKNEKIPI